MERSWYFRLLVILSAIVAAWLFLWPSLDQAGWVSAPDWVKARFERRISPGLDIRGGLRLMYEVEVDEYIRDRRDRYSEQMVRELGALLGVIEDDEMDSISREQLETVGERVTVQRVGRRGIRVVFNDQDDKSRFDTEWLQRKFPDLRLSGDEDLRVDLTMREDRILELTETAVEQAKLTVSNRIDGLGLREATVIGRDSDLIVEIPGADQAAFDRIREIIATTARLEFKVLDEEGTTFLRELDRSTLPEGLTIENEGAPAGETRPSVTSTFLMSRAPKCEEREENCKSARERLEEHIASLTIPDDHQLVINELSASDLPDLGRNEEAWRTFYVFRTTNVTGEDVEDAFVSFDPQEGNRPVVSLQFNASGAAKFEEMTGRNVKRRMAIVLDGKAESAPVIQARIGGGRAQITLGTGDYNRLFDEANALVVVLRAGALPAPLRPANEQLIGPTLGRDSVEKGITGALVGIAIVLLFMLVYYQVAGFIADLMVVLNVLFMLAIMAAFEATLTLPGIAAIALTVGMAVDANVLIIERMREELRAGKSPRSAVDQGFGRAFSSVIDSQLTTFIAGVVLFQYGSGPIKGFAVMLMIGIVTSLFTGVFCSKVAMDWLVRGARVKRLKVG
ncbi:MAG: protein translocase subunit SecD [Sandaracinus sp.]|nr:protein translocase subunit SecD [Sandaracinus sp.]MCB9636237.1 protein translocase subunit SecD [Sandaracinus sp.]